MNKPIKVKTIFMGKIAINQKFCDRAVKEKEDLYIKVGNDLMVIRWNEIDMLGKLSRKTYLDKFSNNFYRLIYFDWQPKEVQETLL